MNKLAININRSWPAITRLWTRSCFAQHLPSSHAASDRHTPGWRHMPHCGSTSTSFFSNSFTYFRRYEGLFFLIWATRRIAILFFLTWDTWRRNHLFSLTGIHDVAIIFLPLPLPFSHHSFTHLIFTAWYRCPPWCT